MQNRPEFDSIAPVDAVELTDEEQATVQEHLARRRELKAAEDQIPEMTKRPRLPK